MEYKDWLIELKQRIKSSQIKAAVAVNSQLILLYWELGRDITEKQQNAIWGSGFIDQLSKDLKAEFPEMGGFSRANLFAIKKIYLFHYQQVAIVHQLDGQNFLDKIPEHEIFQQAAGQIEKIQQLAVQNEIPQIINLCCQIPWWHNVLIIEKIKNHAEAKFYIEQTIENNWSRAVLEMQIESNLYSRQGKAINNFKATMPEIESDLAIALLKDPYNFEFLTLSNKIHERELEQKLVENITNFLLELGKGFAYLGRQFEINVGGKIFKTDLLFYHTKLKCYIIIELKVTEFEPEHLGKLNFYLTAINEIIKDQTDKPTIGILLCKSKNNTVVDFALKDINKPLGISEYTYSQLSAEIKNSLPTEEQLKNQLNLE
jgi:predicted nuclease of restriction endonuclease-like (RecB) superfamily